MKRAWAQVELSRTMPSTYETVDGGQVAMAFTVGLRWHWLTRADNGSNAFEGSSTTRQRAMSAAERAMTSPELVKKPSEKAYYCCPYIQPRGVSKSDPANAAVFQSYFETIAAHKAAWWARYSPEPAY